MLLLIGNGLLGTVLAVRLTTQGFAPMVTGVVMAAYFAGFTLATLYAGPTIGRVGHIRSFAAFAALMSSISLLYGLAPPPWSWLVLRVGTGFSMAVLFMVIESWLNAAASDATRGRVLALYMLMVYLGLGAGQLLLDLWPVERIELLCLVAVTTSLAVIPVALSDSQEPRLGLPGRLPLRAVIDRAPLGMAGAVVAGAATGSIYGVGPIYGALSGLSQAGISFFMGATILGGVLLQWPLGRLSDVVDRRRVLVGVSIAASLVCSLLGWNVLGGRAIYLGGALLGSLAFAIYPLALAHAFDRLDHELVLRASSVLLLGSALGSIAGPILASLAIDAFGPAGFFLFNGVVTVLLALYGVRRIREARPVPVEDREPFRVVPRTTAVVSELDPRCDAEAPPGPLASHEPGVRTPSSPSA